jgi:hypothetical protein
MEPDHEDRDGGLDEMGLHPGVATMEPGHDRKDNDVATACGLLTSRNGGR